ncbi:DUF1570 domain-containing protein, partial [Pseudomonas sp. CGJS7]|uniref:DUF1570 domain-containing protein n=1 Tax=Pseudomonas sp. CGJS7 TaxID=3109348 RepID=UPI0030083BD0
AREHRSEHYAIFSTATPERTAQVAAAVESLYRAYAGFFELADAAKPADRLKLILYRDRAQFSHYNTSMPWAEAYYRKPYCHAYYAERGENPYHWMLHEATHQLNAERAGLAAPRWINEGLATYFGTSVLQDGVLHPGRIDPNTYPIWWLGDLVLSGSLRDDLDNRRLIELRQVIDGSGPALGGAYLNVYYLQFWSLTHFLFHGQGGKYAGAYRKLMRGAGTVEEFEATVGPLERIQQEWYDYLLEKQAEQSLAEQPVQHVPVPQRSADKSATAR